MKSNIKALIIGLIVYLAVYFLKYGYEAAIFSSDAIGSQNRILIFVLSVLALILLVIPSYIAGAFVADNGTLCGFLVAAIGFSLRFFALSTKWGTLPFDWATLSIWLEQMLVPVTVGAVSGAAGQLHRRKRRG